MAISPVGIMAKSHYARGMEQEKAKITTQAGEKYIVRFPEGMRDRIAEAAKASNRSMNAEIVERLQTSLSLESQVVEIKAAASAERSRTERALLVQQDIIKTLGTALEALAKNTLRTYGPNEVIEMLAEAGNAFVVDDWARARKLLDEVGSRGRKAIEEKEQRKDVERPALKDEPPSSSGTPAI